MNLKVSFVFRKRDPRFFSIEKVFETVIAALEDVDTEKIEMPHPGVSLGNLVFLWKQKRGRNSVFHVTGDNTYLPLALPGKRTVLTYHDCNFLHEGSWLKRKILEMLMIRWPVSRSAIVTTISEATRQEILSHTTASHDKVRVVPNPVVSAIPFTEKEFNAAKPRLLFVGVTPNKNLERVAYALKGVSCQLMIIGEPSESQVSVLQQNGIDFEWRSGLTDGEVADEYTKCDIVLFPTLYEGFGLPILEGFQAGRVVVTSDLEPMRTVAGSAALLTDPYDPESIREALVRVCKDHSLRRELVRKGSEVMKAYAPSVIASRYREIYSLVLKQQRSCVE